MTSRTVHQGVSVKNATAFGDSVVSAFTVITPTTPFNQKNHSNSRQMVIAREEDQRRLRQSNQRLDPAEAPSRRQYCLATFRFRSARLRGRRPYRGSSASGRAGNPWNSRARRARGEATGSWCP